MAVNQENVSKVLSVLSHPLRRDILLDLSNNGEQSFTDLLNMLKVDTGKLSFHLRALSPFIEQTSSGKYKLSRAGEAAVRRQIPALLASNDPMDPIVGLALLASFNAWDLQPDWSGFAPGIPLAAADLCAALFEPQVARDLLVHWMSRVGGPQAAGEKAHDLLLKANLPYGGGSAALDFMQGANDPQAIFIGLYEFAVDPRLPGAVRSDALVRLRARMAPDAYRDIVRECVERARADEEDWALRAEHLQARLDAAVDRRFVETELADPYPGLVEDLELQLRSGLAENRLEIDPETAAFFRDALNKLDAAALSGPDRAAALRLRRLLDSKLR